VADRPIIMATTMVRAILNGRKTQTRRIAKGITEHHERDSDLVCPFGKIGDRLYVREKWMPHGLEAECTGPEDVAYAATCSEAQHAIYKWRPSIHMPKWAARIWLEITNVRLERLNDITNDDAFKEGVCDFVESMDRPNSWKGLSQDGRNAMVSVTYGDTLADGGIAACSSFQRAFRHLWESVKGMDSWDENPWVWVIEFKRVKDQGCVCLEHNEN
jgi:hypothetical protein